MMKDRVKLPFYFEPAKLQADLEKIDWTDHFVKRNYEGSWCVIPLRSAAGAEHAVMMIYSDPSAKEFVDTPFLDYCPYFEEVLGIFECPLDAVRLMKLVPGSKNKEHVDHDLDAALGLARLHIPVMTNPGVTFYLNGERVIMDEGELWYLRLNDPHWVVNEGSEDRVHLVLDVRANDWLKDLIQ